MATPRTPTKRTPSKLDALLSPKPKATEISPKPKALTPAIPGFDKLPPDMQAVLRGTVDRLVKDQTGQPPPRTKKNANPKALTLTPGLTKFVYEHLEGDAGGKTPPFNPKWRSAEEQSYIVLAALALLRAVMLGDGSPKGLTADVKDDCLFLLDTVIAFLNAIDLTGLAIQKERAQRVKGGKGKAA